MTPANSTDFTQPLQSWTGCDWPTEFGPLKLNLNGIRSRQARTAGNATRGPEAEQWLQAAKWLEAVERDALNAQQLAVRYAQARIDGNQQEAERLRAEIQGIEAHYPERFGVI